MENTKKLPVTILTGFLGVGKTTFLNHILQENKNVRYAIIENEFGEQGIDGELVVHSDETIVELNNGCLCCTLNDNLYDILNELFDRREEFDEIIIEATGVADPTGLAQPFIAHPMVKKQFPLRGIVCLVDSLMIEEHLRETEEAKGQVAFCDVLLINKTDLVVEEQVDFLVEKLQQINPIAKIMLGNKNDFPSINFDQKNSKMEEIFLQTNPLISGVEEDQFPIQKPHSHHHHEHTKEINSQTFIFDKPFDPASLDRHLFVYLMFQSAGLYRMKGLFWIEGSDDQYLAQSVGKQLDFEVYRPWKPGETRKSMVVFIGKNLQREGLEKLLNRCLSKEMQNHFK